MLIHSGGQARLFAVSELGSDHLKDLFARLRHIQCRSIPENRPIEVEVFGVLCDNLLHPSTGRNYVLKKRDITPHKGRERLSMLEGEFWVSGRSW